MHNLFCGPAIIIDDMIGGDGQDIINQLVSDIEEKNIPCAKYTELPDEGIVKHLSGVSFLVLDWKLHPDGVSIPDSVINQNIDFLKEVLKEAFIPIFIFTAEDIESVKEKLEDSGLYDAGGSNFIFVENKSELIGKKLFRKITEWVKETPSVYVLKEWEKEYNKSKAALFSDFYSLNHSWPKVLWSAYESDNVDPSYGLGEVITRNLHTRMSPLDFDSKLLNSRHSPSREQLRMVLSGERFIENKNDRLKQNSISSGDVFKFKKPGKSKYSYFINIRPDCDCITRDSCSIDGVQLYLLELSRLSDNQEQGKFSERYGNFDERDNNAFIFNMYEGRSFEVLFKELKILTWSELKNFRIGRLLPPYITRVQQRYSLYLQRQGVPRTPLEAVVVPSQPASSSTES